MYILFIFEIPLSFLTTTPVRQGGGELPRYKDVRVAGYPASPRLRSGKQTVPLKQ